ncbi:bacteriohemerythrin [Thalassotalea atypica]|uniref:bacteriohemerythrin n=1 Tax=Thalassotalea atypica TaxID=2054316 RepID=UPI0025747FD3|nr:bacteriohemerythrin [Thalassotalea atypica]
MNNRTKSLIYAAVIGLIIVTIFLGFLSSITNPVSWILIVVLLLISTLYKKAASNKEMLWKEEYSVGVDVLDNDHKKLISLLNQFTTAYDYAMSEEYEREALNDLVNYTKHHFQREEELMANAQYPDLENHKKQHVVMIEQVGKFVELYNEQGHDSMNEISTFLTNWLINHIQGTDQEYTEHLNSKGIK